LKYLFGLHIKSLITGNLKNFGSTFGLGGQLPPLPPPLATRLDTGPCSCFFQECEESNALDCALD